MDRPETIELVGQTLRWSGEGDWETARPNERPRLSAYYSGGNGVLLRDRVVRAHESHRLRPTLETLDLALRAELAEVADAVAAWLLEREARIHADAAKMAMELAAQRNALSEAIDTVCGPRPRAEVDRRRGASNAFDDAWWEARGPRSGSGGGARTSSPTRPTCTGCGGYPRHHPGGAHVTPAEVLRRAAARDPRSGQVDAGSAAQWPTERAWHDQSVRHALVR